MNVPSHIGTDLRCQVWCRNAFDTQSAHWVGTEFVPAVSRIFSCAPEARAWIETYEDTHGRHHGRDFVILPVALIRSVIEVDRQGTSYVAISGPPPASMVIAEARRKIAAEDAGETA